MNRRNRGRRIAAEVTSGHAARLLRFVTLLGRGPRGSEEILGELGVGVRTFYRELALVKKHGIRVARRGRAYTLLTPPEEAEARLPFPDPQLSFAEMAELSRHPGEAAQRLARLLDSVINAPVAPRKGARGRKGAKGK